MDHRSYDGYGSCRCDCTNIFFNSFNTGVRSVKVGRSRPFLEHFAELLDNGKKYPTDADLTAWGIKDEVEFIRSHVRKRAIESRADRLLQDTYENRNLFMNIPVVLERTSVAILQRHLLTITSQCGTIPTVWCLELRTFPSTRFMG